MSAEAAKIKDIYEQHASHWDQDRSRDLFERPWLDRFLSLVPPGGSILDIGCGSAEPIASFFVARGYRVTGVDSSPSMIAICRGRFPEQSWIVGDMRELHLKSQFEALIAWDSLIHLRPEDQAQVFPLFREHSAPNAVLMFTSGPGRGDKIGQYRGEPLYHGSLDAAEYRKLLNENGFSILAHVVEDATCGHHTVWLAKLV